MKMLRHASVCLLAVACAGFAAWAQGGGTVAPAAGQAAARHAPGTPNIGCPALDYFAGNWQCQSQIPTPGYPSKFSFTGEWWTKASKVWMLITSGSQGVEYLGCVPKTQQVVAISVGNTGNWGNEKAPGWQDNQLALTGVYSYWLDPPNPCSDTFTKTNANQFNLVSKIQLQGAWKTVANYDCSRVTGK
jgi:hypothetical protein